MGEQEFKEFIAEMMPLAEKMIEVAKKYNPGGQLITMTCNENGYLDISNHRYGVAARVNSLDEMEIRKYSEG